MLILYAEDDPEDVDVFLEVVKMIDSTIKCIVAKDGAEALRILEEAVVLPELIFLDVNMPLLNGAECLARLKRNADLRHIPVIIYTTSNNKEDAIAFRRLGAADFVKKPTSFQEVKTCLARILDGA